MSRLSLVDLAFLAFDTPENPKHVGAVFTFRKPAGARRSYVRDLYAHFLDSDRCKSPFNSTIQISPLRFPRWKEAADLDMSRHVHYERMPPKSTHRDLLDRVAELHEPTMDRHYPLWSFHLIDNVARGRFAIYCRAHHAYGDGITLTKWINQMFARVPEDRSIRPFWEREHNLVQDRRRETNLQIADAIRHAAGTARSNIRSYAGLQKLFMEEWLERLHFTHGNIGIPFHRKKTPLTGQVASGRTLSTTSIPMKRINRLRRRTRSSLNHVMLTCLDAALSSYLEEVGVALAEPLTIGMPVSLRPESDDTGGNQLCLAVVTLSNPTHDIIERMKAIEISLHHAKVHARTLPAQSLVAYSLLVSTAAQLAETAHLSNVMPPVTDTLISNVPGPREKLYLGEAEMLECYPISTLPPGLHLNITLYSYADNLYVGMVSTKEKLPQVELLPAHVDQAFCDLEAAVL